MASTYEPISTTTLGSAASSITFSSISGSYTDLVLTLVATTDASGKIIRLTFNSDTGSNYSLTQLIGEGSSALSGRYTNSSSITLNDSFTSTTIPTFQIVNIFSYAGSTYKTCLISDLEDKNGSGEVMAAVGLWRSTSAITSITLATNSGNFASGTTATLYGIKAA